MEQHIYDFQIRVLLYQEDGEFAAHALEMDLMGYGKTESSAIEELQQMIRSQVSFARQKNDESLLLFPAEPAFFERWEKAHEAALKQQVFPDKVAALDVKAVCLTFDEKTISELPRSGFELACA